MKFAELTTNGQEFAIVEERSGGQVFIGTKISDTHMLVKRRRFNNRIYNCRHKKRKVQPEQVVVPMMQVAIDCASGMMILMGQAFAFAGTATGKFSQTIVETEVRGKAVIID